MNQILPEDEAAKLVEPYLHVFRTCYENAFTKLNNMLSHNPEPLFLRAKATMLHNLVINEVKSQFVNLTDIRLIERYESLSLVIKGRVSARFKKLNQHGFPSNVRTRRNDGIVHQQLQLSLPFVDAPEITCIDVGYVVNATWTGFSSLKVLCRIGDSVLWSFPISSNTSTTHTINIPEKESNASRVKVKTDNKQKTG